MILEDNKVVKYLGLMGEKMKNRNGLTMGLAYWGMISLAALGLFAAPKAGAPRSSWSVEDNIENARQIWEIEKIDDLDDKGQREEMKKFLESERVPVARAAVRRIAIIDAERAIEILENTHHSSELVGTTARMALTILQSSTAESAIQNAASFVEDSNYSSHVGIMPLVDDINAICRGRGWGNRLPEKYAYWLKEYSEYEGAMISLSTDDKIACLIDSVWNFNTPRQRDAAMNMLIDDIGKSAILSILAKLKNATTLPSTTPPPFEKAHYCYDALINLIISIPDERSLPLLNELAQSANPYVANEAKDAIKWVTSGVPYPYKYNTLMIVNPPPGDYTH